MYFSEHFSIEDPVKYDWFDQILEVDTRLFVDPFQIFKEPSEGSWKGAHDELIEYFQRTFERLAGHQDNPDSIQYKKALKLMEFPEPQEFGLGFVHSGRRGSGTGSGFAKRIVLAMSEAINRGLQDMRHFEELGLLVEKIGRDRISDITCNILKPRFIEYTQRVATELGIDVAPVEVEHSVFDGTRMSWSKGTFDLPVNPVNGMALLLVPHRFLRELPMLDAVDWWNFVEPGLRIDLNLHINDHIRKKDILDKARANTDLIRDWSDARESSPAEPYPVHRDPEGLHNWQARTRDVARRYPLDLVSVDTQDELMSFVSQVIAAFKHQVEEEGHWKLLFNDDTGKPKREESIQLLFRGVVQSYCRAYSVAVDREVELGRGPVDFVFAKDVNIRLLLEIKKMNNGRFWEGLKQQLTSYMESDLCNSGWFLAVRVGDTPVQARRTRALAAVTAELVDSTGFDVRSEWVDARPKESASNLTGEDEGVRPTPLDPEFDEE